MPRKFGIQVKVRNPDTKEDEWRWMRPAGRFRYEFDSGELAHRMKEMCYPQSTIEEVRVAEIVDELSSASHGGQ